MNTLLQQSFGEFSTGWFVLSVVLGGLIAAFLRFLIDVRLTESYKAQRMAEAKIRQYSYPLLVAASDVELRIETILTKGIKARWLASCVVDALNQGKGFLEDPCNGTGYFYLSTLYVFARYFAWLEILRRETGYLDFPKRAGRAQPLYDTIHRINNSFRYTELWDVEGQTKPQDFTKLHRHIQTAIGEIMLVDRKGQLDCLSFYEFVDRYTTQDDEKFRFWLRNLGKYFEGLSDLRSLSPEDLLAAGEYRVLRLVVAQYWFYRLVKVLDPKYNKVQHRASRHEDVILERLPASIRQKATTLPVD